MDMILVVIIKKMLRKILQKVLKLSPDNEPSQIFTHRSFLRARQSQDLRFAGTLPCDPTLLNKSLSQLSKQRSTSLPGTFISRCPKFSHLQFLADTNIKPQLWKNPTGIPFTVKDHLQVANMISTCGYSSNIATQNQNSDVVQLLISQGCIPYAHTNLPQGLFNIQTGNRVYGVTENPYGRGFGSGGSSGGDGVAVATRCAVFGLASDSAGSARIPAAYCGVVGFKPTGSQRLSRKGRLGINGKQNYSFSDLDTSLGYITRSVDDLSWLCQRTLGLSPNGNPYITHKWDSNKYEAMKKKKLRIGYMIEDHEMKAVPAVRNCIMEAVEVLRANGHQVVEWKFDQLHKFRDFTIKLLNITGAIRSINARLGGEAEAMQAWWIHERSLFGRLGTKIRKALATSDLERSVYEAYDVGNTLMDYVRACQYKNKVKQAFLKKWSQSSLDILLTPVTPFTAPLKNSNQFLLHQLTFCSFQNILSMPCGTVPVRQVLAPETKYTDTGFYESRIRSSVMQSEGLPVGVQITAPYMEDQMCVAALWQLEKLVKGVDQPKEREI